MKKLLFALSIAILVAGCTLLGRSDYEQKVKAFLSEFEANLAQSDALVLTQFKTSKPQEAILKVVRIMQNATPPADSVMCTVKFSEAVIVFEDVDIRVEIPAVYQSTHAALNDTREARFTFWLTSEDGDLFITRIEAEEFYMAYQVMVHDMNNKSFREQAIASRKIFYDQARTLQQTYDTVVWYTQYMDSIYYYVVNGSWEGTEGNFASSTVQMGLVSESGRVVVPPQFGLVGTLGFAQPDLVEVQINNLVGYYQLDGREIIPPAYNWVVFYDDEATTALVKQDSLYGWLDKAYQFHAGFRNHEQEIYIREFAYLANTITISRETVTAIESLDPERLGLGIAIPPAYLTKANIFAPVISELNLGTEAAYYGTEFIETKGNFFERLSDDITVLFTMIKGRYLGGREEFYETREATFFDNRGDNLASVSVYAGDNSLTWIDSTLLQLNLTPTVWETNNYWDMEGSSGEWNTPRYRYLHVSRNPPSVEVLESSRQYDQTEFVKLDSSYVTGTFVYWDENTSGTVIRDFVSDETLRDMRNEILAAYGFQFADPQTQERFDHRQNYQPRYTKYADFIESMTEIDRHNLLFLDRLIGTLDETPSI